MYSHPLILIALPSTVISRRVLADVLLVLVLNTGKDYLLADVGVFWVLVRVLACGGLVAMIWLVASSQFQTKRFTEVRIYFALILPVFLKASTVVCRRHVVAVAIPPSCRSLHGPLSLTLNPVSVRYRKPFSLLMVPIVRFYSRISLPSGSKR